MRRVDALAGAVSEALANAGKHGGARNVTVYAEPDGQGRVFYMALGHSERIYAMKPMLEHMLAGMQYALGDLKADDSPSQK